MEDKNDPALLADTCVRELVGRASFGHVRSVLKPVLRLVGLFIISYTKSKVMLSDNKWYYFLNLQWLQIVK